MFRDWTISSGGGGRVQTFLGGNTFLDKFRGEVILFLTIDFINDEYLSIENYQLSGMSDLFPRTLRGYDFLSMCLICLSAANKRLLAVISSTNKWLLAVI